ncbi:hypothetical protein [Bradyrhizobium sp. WSM3983]|uniref:hypothetical protein n=1 Tax=Bradyrhizobium sp. WSM3983 TaxID=1038867 RepID=UPI00047FDEC6|nr:hypothetical protein [Bradyrhizobium sp. WSM3983]
MSKIVEDAKPYAKRLIVGDTHLLDIAGQEALSTWIALSALMADQITKHPLKLPASDVAYFFEHKRPPAHWYVGAGFYDGPRVLAFNHAPFRMGHEEADGKEVTDLVKHVYATMIGNLFTIVDVLTFYSLPIAKPPAYYSSYLMQIHPHKFEAIPFPPPSQCMIQGPGQFEVGTHAMKVARMAIDPIVAYLKSIGGSPGFLSK